MRDAWNRKKKLLQPLIAHVQVLHLTRFCITHYAENIALVLKVQKNGISGYNECTYA